MGVIVLAASVGDSVAAAGNTGVVVGVVPGGGVMDVAVGVTVFVGFGNDVAALVAEGAAVGIVSMFGVSPGGLRAIMQGLDNVLSWRKLPSITLE